MAIKVVSLFSGGGGLDLGFKMAGYDIIWAIDSEKNAVDTYKANIGNHIICDDINDIDVCSIPKADVVIGGPPCQSFSLAGNRHTEDARGQLVWKYIHIIECIKPKAFLFENVTGLLSAKNSKGEKIIDLLKKAFVKIGYTISTKVINAADYGIPQMRRRVIIVGLRSGKKFAFPAATHNESGIGLKKYVSVQDALGDLPKAILDENAVLRYETEPFTEYQREMRNGKGITEHFISKMSELDKYIVSHVKPGGNYMDIPSDVKSERIKRLQRDGGHTTCYGRLLPDKPSYTINTYFNRPNVGCNIHYSEDRLITVREALRLQSFPDSYIIVSSSKQGRNLIVGNAVPPMLARVMAEQLKKYLEDKQTMWISYSDSEVNVFHPICEKALNRALELMGKEKTYRVVHHQYTGALEMDYCVQNIKTGKYLCVVEVKRTSSDVHSSRYQFQAMSYVQMNSGNNEKPFYILTNLECAFAFRYDSKRPRVFQQMLKPGLTTIGFFKDYEQEVFESRLAEYFKKMLSDFCDDKYNYLVTLEEFARHMEMIKDTPKKWKSHLAVLLYEYIRGAFACVNRNDLKDVRLFKENVEKICNEAIRVNFKDIFNYSLDNFEDRAIIDNDTLVDIFDFGNQNVTGDSVSGLLHQIVSEGHEHDGEVPTDLELGRLVAALAKSAYGSLSDDELICDPAAGSGNLISSAIDIFNLTPNQILVNDVNPKLLELLSLRLGLNFAKTICRANSPTIENKDIVDLEKDFFKDVKIVVMNPPFVAGINCVARKRPLFKRIKELKGSKPISDVGQMPFECVFLELLTLLVPDGTTIACVFPKTHLMARGSEAKIIRKIVVDNFGLNTVFIYPGNEIFDDVVKDTCVIVGKTNHPSENISVISSYDKIPDIDTHKFAQSLENELTNAFAPIMSGVVAKRIPLDELKASITDGWRDLNSELTEAVNFVRNNFEMSKYLVPLSKCDVSHKRGTAGNSGASDLIFFDSREDLYNASKRNPSLILKPAMRNAKLNSFDICDGDTKFLDISENDESLIGSIVDAYLRLPERKGKQQKKAKSKDELIKILKKEARAGFQGNAVLIPRNIRRNGRVYLSTKPVFVSTNFVVFNLPNEDKAVILSTWMSTIFYQMICEVSSKDQEGARKMEVEDILATLVPEMSKMTEAFVAKLKKAKDNIEFVDLQSPKIREIDKLWAKELFGDTAESMLDDTCRLLGFLANKRNT